MIYPKMRVCPSAENTALMQRDWECSQSGNFQRLYDLDPKPLNP